MEVDRKGISCSGVCWRCEKYVNMFFNTNQFLSLSFCGPHKKPHRVKGSSKHYHLWFDPKIGHRTCGIWWIICACVECTSMLDKPWVNVLPPQQQPRYQPVTYCTYCTLLGSFNNWNIITFPHKATTGEIFEEKNKVFLVGIGNNMESLV